MPSINLTDRAIQLLRTDDRQYELFDSKVTRLGIRVSPGGKKSFIYIYRFKRKSKRMTIGPYPQISLQQARTIARDFAYQLSRGIDPNVERKSDDKITAGIKFSALVDEFIENSAKRTTKSWRETERILRKQFIPQFGNVYVHELAKARIHAALDLIYRNSGPSAANHAHANVRRCLNYAVERGHIDRSPCSGMKRPARTSERNRVLTDDELRRIMKTANDVDYPFGPFIKSLVLTGQRRNDVAKMEWSHLDFATRTWHQPGEANKSGHKHIVPLSDQMGLVLQSIPRLSEKHVFPARGSENAISGFSRWKKAFDRRSGTSGWTLHDLRRTAATGMALLGVAPHVIELVLNHRSGQLSGIARIYNRHEYLDEQREALQRWADRVTAIGSAPSVPAIEPNPSRHIT